MTEQPSRIDLDDDADTAERARKLDITRDQPADAIKAVGDLAADVELHLKGTRASTNPDVAEQAAVGGNRPS